MQGNSSIWVIVLCRDFPVYIDSRSLIQTWNGHTVHCLHRVPTWPVRTWLYRHMQCWVRGTFPDPTCLWRWKRQLYLSTWLEKKWYAMSYTWVSLSSPFSLEHMKSLPSKNVYNRPRLRRILIPLYLCQCMTVVLFTSHSSMHATHLCQLMLVTN